MKIIVLNLLEFYICFINCITINNRKSTFPHKHFVGVKIL